MQGLVAALEQKPLLWVNMLFDPSVSMATASAGMTSAGGRCHSFDARADGYVRGEACGTMALQLASEAAVGTVMVRGTAVRQDGRSASLTAPRWSCFGA